MEDCFFFLLFSYFKALESKINSFFGFIDIHYQVCLFDKKLIKFLISISKLSFVKIQHIIFISKDGS